MKRAVFLLLIGIFSMAHNPYRPDRVVTGKVKDAENGKALPGVSIVLKSTTRGVVTDHSGSYSIRVPQSGGILVFRMIGYKTKAVKVGDRSLINVRMELDMVELEEVVVMDKAVDKRVQMSHAIRMRSNGGIHQPLPEAPIRHNTEEYATIHENIFLQASRNPLSTFSIDVDAASYSNIRRFLNNGQLPPKDAVRIEEMVNYFHYTYEDPKGADPFDVITELSEAPWQPEHRLVHIGLKGKDIPTDDLPPSNLVFLIDVSGSMDAPNKLPLLKSSFHMLAQQLRPQDKVSIVVYAGAAGLVLPPTSGSDRSRIITALNELHAGGSTAGGAGIQLAYSIAKQNYTHDGNNRVILATDGDFNVGASSNAAMERLIEEKRQDGIFLTVLGFGMGNYKDSKMEILADKGNGNYAYIDNILEAKKVLVNEFGGTLFTIAKDVKLQVEFNPAKVQAYRLIGYENRKLQNEDFNNDKKDAGDLGSGHTVTALYEIIPVGVKSDFIPVDELKYQSSTINPSAYKSKEMLTVKLRYKDPNGSKSKLLVKSVLDVGIALQRTSDNFRWSAAVASFGMLLRDSEFKGAASHSQVLELAEGAKGEDPEGYRAELIRLVKSCQLLARR